MLNAPNSTVNGSMKSIDMKGRERTRNGGYLFAGPERIDDGQSAFNDLAVMQIFGIEHFSPGLKGCGDYKTIPT